MAARTFKVLGLIFDRPSETIQTTTFFQASGPQVRERSRVVKWRMFFMTPCIVRVKRTSSSCEMHKQKEKENKTRVRFKVKQRGGSAIKKKYEQKKIFPLAVISFRVWACGRKRGTRTKDVSSRLNNTLPLFFFFSSFQLQKPSAAGRNENNLFQPSDKNLRYTWS